jgi:hypothetical protein
MIQHAFLITSAINTKFGVFSSEQRLQQTIDTINSINGRVPNARIYLVEMAAIPLTDEQRAKLTPLVDGIINFDDDQDVKDIFNSSTNWDWVKNATEVMCFKQAVEQLTERGVFKDIDRIHKISGRYTLGDAFDLNVYEKIPDKIVVKTAMTSQFPPHVTGNIPVQYMSRLWSWPTALTDQVIKAYEEGFVYIAERISQGGYCDIEHMLYKFLPQEHIQEIPRTGVSGNIGPNGARVDD